MSKLKMPLHKEIIRVGGVLVILTGEKFCHSRGLQSALYDLVSMKNGKVSFLLIVNGDRQLVI